jgi:hypothetical protein
MILKIIKNTIPAPNYGSMFGQDVEPYGTYVLEKDFEGPISSPWVQGTAELNNPLIINITSDTQISYKYDLAKEYKAKNKSLTKKLMAKGYDGIITRYPNGESNEIVLFPNARFMLHPIDEVKTLIKKKLRESLLETVKGGEFYVYHGSDYKIQTFVDDFVDGITAKSVFGPGIYFSNVEQDAAQFGKNMHKVILTPRLLFDNKKVNRGKIEPILINLIKMKEDWEMIVYDWDENLEKGFKKLMDSIFIQNEDEVGCLLQVWGELYRYDSIEYVRNCVKLGIDGIVVKNENKFNSSYFIIYNPNILKMFK